MIRADDDKNDGWCFLLIIISVIAVFICTCVALDARPDTAALRAERSLIIIRNVYSCSLRQGG